ncbi:MAG: rod shape-determining protein MreC [Pseudomonadota bacterium]|nr:rod shape-determining protein MreC [Pseudomonadota bacterium]
MSLRDGPLGDVRPPILWLAGVALAVAAVAALVLFLGDRQEGARARVYTASRNAADSAIAPVGDVLTVPVRWIGNGARTVGDYFFAASENGALRRRLAAALTWRDRALALGEENARLKALMGITTNPPLPVVFARAVIDARGPFSNTRLIDAGASRGIVEGNPALGEHGLVGRVVGVASGVSRVLLLTDVESRTPVLIARTNGRAILTGDGGPSPQLAWLRTHEALREGDRVLTSGDGGVLPRGLPVGAAIKGADGSWRVALDSDGSPIDFVQILLFKTFAQLAPPGALQPRDLPSTATEAPVAPTPTSVTPPASKAAGRAPAR